MTVQLRKFFLHFTYIDNVHFRSFIHSIYLVPPPFQIMMCLQRRRCQISSWHSFVAKSNDCYLFLSVPTRRQLIHVKGYIFHKVSDKLQGGNVKVTRFLHHSRWFIPLVAPAAKEISIILICNLLARSTVGSSSEKLIYFISQCM